MSNRPYDPNQYHPPNRGNAAQPPIANGNRAPCTAQPPHQLYFNPPQNRLVVHDHDVLSGRGVNIAHHPGNERFRALITAYQDKSFCTSYSASEKKAIARDIVDHIISLDPPGRFLKRDGRGQVARGLGGPWEQLSDRDAMKKTCQALRDCNRTDRTGYADGVAAPTDVVEKVKKLSSQGLSAKDRAAEAAAKNAAEAAKNAASSDTLKRRREETQTSSYVHPTIPSQPSAHPVIHPPLNHNPGVVPSQLLPMSVAALNSYPPSMARQALPQPSQQHPFLPHLYPSQAYNTYSTVAAAAAASASGNAAPTTAPSAFSHLHAHPPYYDPSSVQNNFSEMLALPIYERGISPQENSDQMIKKQRTEDTERSSEPSSSNTSTPLNAAAASMAERVGYGPPSSFPPSLNEGIEDPNLFQIKELEDNNDNTSAGWDDAGNSASMDQTDQFNDTLGNF